MERYQTESVKLDAEVQASRARIALLDSMRQRTPEDTLLELTAFPAPPGYLGVARYDRTARSPLPVRRRRRIRCCRPFGCFCQRLKDSQHLMSKWRGPRGWTSSGSERCEKSRPPLLRRRRKSEVEST